MTPERARDILPILQAYAEGKVIEYRRSSLDPWLATTRPAFSDGIDYRVKPELKLRPWKTEEVPIGWQVRRKGINPSAAYRHVIADSDGNIVNLGADGHATLSELVIEFECAPSGPSSGNVWRPCGVEE